MAVLNRISGWGWLEARLTTRPYVDDDGWRGGLVNLQSTTVDVLGLCVA